MFLFAFPFWAEARDRVYLPPTKALTLDCIVLASQDFNVPLAVLLGILSVEGGRVGEALSNTNGTWDMGPFQINTCHSNLLKSKGIAPKNVLTDGCVNANFAAWLLKDNLQRTGNIWSAVAAYHSGTPHRGQAYAQKVHEHILNLQKQGVTALLALHKDGTP